MHLPIVRKRKSWKSGDFPHLTCQRRVHLGQLDRSSPDNTFLGFGGWQAISTCNPLTCRGYHTWHRKNTRPYLGARQTRHPLLVKTITPNIRYSPSTLNNLFRLYAGSELGELMYCLGSTKYTSLHDTLRHVSTFHVSLGTGAQTLDP